jgi:ABC-type branched-subunit amino acid transport system ATPase component
MALHEVFDFKFDQLVVQYRAPEDSFGNFELQSESFLNFGRPGVIVLLGKNGAGKSRFLNGLKIFGKRQSIEDPAISLRYSVPTVEEYIEYSEARKSLVDELFVNHNDFYALQFAKNKELNLFFHDAVIRSIAIKAIKSSFRDDFGVESLEMLQLFEFPESEINDFARRKEDHIIEFGSYHPDQQFLETPRENLHFREYFAEFFLALLAGSFVHNVPWEVGSGNFFDCSEYLSDKEERVRLVGALRDLFENATHTELACHGGDVYFSLIAERVPGVDLGEVLTRFHEYREKYDNLSFPFDLLRPQSAPSSRYLKLELPEQSPYAWQPYGVLDLTFQKREESIDGLNELFRSFLKLQIEAGDSADYEVKVSGLGQLNSLLQLVNSLLPDVEIGISKIGLQRPDHEEMKFEASQEVRWYLTDKRNHDFTPIINWHDSVSKSWLPLETCSDGQLDVLRILINLCNFTTSTSKADVKFLLVDEFDRHLHPVVAQQLLNLLDRYAKKNTSYVILSTHSFGSLEIHKYKHLFASRDLRGFQQLSTNQQEDSKLLAYQLGVPEIDTRKLKKLLVIVEGMHEEIIFNNLLLKDRILADIEIIRGDGLYGLANFWRSQLQYENADVLIVYDKRNNQLEEEWLKIKEKNRRAKIVENLWTRYPEIDELLKVCLRRKIRMSGDTELRTLAFMLKDILVINENQIKSIRRLHLHGVDVPDIVDCLPISEFPGALHFHTWVQLREANPNLHPEEFKREFRITTDSVTKAVKNLKDWNHPELQRFYTRILGIVDLPSDWPNN